VTGKKKGRKNHPLIHETTKGGEEKGKRGFRGGGKEGKKKEIMDIKFPTLIA